MSEEAPKSVTVTVPVNTTTSSVQHPGATHIEVEEGHLHVKKDSGRFLRTVAIYAPGKWINGTVNL
ncbi:hypothetical protein AB0M91_19615 [Micromonospora rifamycinica]|uniref:hypothetical protein n=1 Tax=Micromonospora rifamycinica TaxID=291594 RepID=UPI0034174127